MTSYVIGLDLGQAQDYSALIAIECQPARFDVRWIERFMLGTPYPDIVERVLALLGRAPLVGATLIVDKTGVGAAVVDLFRLAYGNLATVTITGGDQTTEDPKQPGHYRVPKRDLVSAVQAPLQTQRLKFAAGLSNVKLLTDELLAFRATISATGHDSYEAWRERDHDDLVLALAIGLWYAEVGVGFGGRPWSSLEQTITGGWVRR